MLQLKPSGVFLLLMQFDYFYFHNYAGNLHSVFKGILQACLGAEINAFPKDFGESNDTAKLLVDFPKS